MPQSDEPAAGTETTAPTETTAATEVPRPAVTTEEAASAVSGGYTGLLANTYDVSYEICRDYGPAKIAKDLGVAADEDSVALAFSRLSTEDHRQASYEGCFRGFLDR